MTIGHQLGLRLFVEGVETPVIAASLSISPDTPVAAAIQVIATDKVLNLLPRTVVHLFFYDFVDASYPIDDPNSKFGSDEDQRNSQYKLLFMGELQGISFQKDANSRQVVLQCVDLSNYWDTTYQYNFGGSLLGGRQHAAFIGANTNLFNSPLGHGTGSVAALFNSKSVNFPELKGLLAGIVHCLEAIGGSYYGETTFKGANDFTSIAELRLKILQQITAAEKDTSTAKLFARKAFNMWMNRQMGSLPKLVTFRGLVQIIQQFVFHNIFPCPVARYVEKETDLKKTKTFAIDITKDPRARKFISQVKSLRSTLLALKDNIQRWNKTEVYEGHIKYTQTAARGVTTATNTMALQNNLTHAVGISTGFRYGGTPSIPGLLKEVQTIDKAIMTVLKNTSIVGGPLDQQKIQDSSKRLAAVKAIDEAVAACDTILGIRVKKSREITYDKLDRVNNQILRPDIWFCAAPRCNVLFPELYQSFQWSRNFLREVTRLELQTTNEILGDDALFNGRYYAPDVADMRNGLKLSSRRFGRLIMAHELLTGIIPMYEKLSEANLFAMKSSQVVYKGAKVSYAQRSVNHQYFKYRFATRQMAAEGRFNPWFVPGFPSVIIDRPMDAEKLLISGLNVEEQLKALSITAEKDIAPTKAMLLQKLVPNQFFGCCTGLQHSLNQQGGITSYSFEQARIHREDTEFLGVDKASVSKKLGTARKKSVVAALSQPKVGSRGPRGGQITAVRNVTGAYTKKILPALRENRRVIVGTSGASLRKPMGAQTTFQLMYGPYGEKGEPAGNGIYGAYEVTESYARRVKVQIDLPIEEAIHPPWIWDGWRDLKIGETYMQFFGVNSITDIEKYTASQIIMQKADEEARTALLESQEGVATGARKKDETTDEFFERIANESGASNAKNTVPPDPVGPAAESQKVDTQAILAIEKERTIENAVDYLVRVYSFIKHYSLDAGEFIRNYTWRPVANMVEIMGSAEFFILEDPDTPGSYITSGHEGFHSRAFGDVADLFGLVDPKVKKVLGLSKEKTQATAKKLDVRRRRRQLVWEYVDEITSSKGLLG